MINKLSSYNLSFAKNNKASLSSLFPLEGKRQGGFSPEDVKNIQLPNLEEALKTSGVNHPITDDYPFRIITLDDYGTRAGMPLQYNSPATSKASQIATERVYQIVKENGLLKDAENIPASSHMDIPKVKISRGPLIQDEFSMRLPKPLCIDREKAKKLGLLPSDDE